MEDPSEGFRGLTARLYDQWHPHPDQYELAYYRELCQAAGGPALEAACGTGRLLLPLLREKLVVEGADASAEMLAICRARAERAGLRPELHLGTMQDLQLERRFGLIFVALGSFQLIQDRDEAMQALRRFHDALLPGGAVAIYLFPPWSYPVPAPGAWNVRRDSVIGKQRCLVHERCEHDALLQMIHGSHRFEVWEGEHRVECQQDEFRVRWYSRFEFESLLGAAGYTRVLVRPSPWQDLQGSGALLFEGRRP